MSFPKTIYVVLANEGEEDQYLEASEKLTDFVEVGESRRVAKYQLFEIGDVCADVKYEPQ